MNAHTHKALIAFLTKDPQTFASALVNTIDTARELDIHRMTCEDRKAWVLDFLVNHDAGLWSDPD